VLRTRLTRPIEDRPRDWPDLSLLAPPGHYVTFVEARKQDRNVGSARLTATAELEREYPNIRAVLAWAVERQEAHRGLRLAGSLNFFWTVSVTKAAAASVNVRPPPGTNSQWLLVARRTSFRTPHVSPCELHYWPRALRSRRGPTTRIRFVSGDDLDATTRTPQPG
jgi:hypothetical protein